jgi:3-oxoacyl-[acyl-carrier protein] reductase
LRRESTLSDPADRPVTVVTGARKGIGRALAEHYCQRGHAVVGVSRSASDLDMENYEHFECDVSEEKRIQQLIRHVRDIHGKVDNLINNAGVASMNHALTTPVSTVTKSVSTNFLGTFLFCREVAKLMSRRRYGRIVNVSSVAVPLALEGEAVYAATKAAVETLSRVLAKELAPFQITVNTVGPGPLDTDLTRSVPKDKIDNILERQAFHELCTLDSVLGVVDFFLDPRNRLVTGQTVYLGGVW